MILRILFEDLVMRLKHIQQHDVWRALRAMRLKNKSIAEMFDEAPILYLAVKRNNFFHLGECLFTLFGVGIFRTHNKSMYEHKDFIEQNGILVRDNLRSQLINALETHVSRHDKQYFTQNLVNQ